MEGGKRVVIVRYECPEIIKFSKRFNKKSCFLYKFTSEDWNPPPRGQSIDLCELSDIMLLYQSLCYTLSISHFCLSVCFSFLSLLLDWRLSLSLPLSSYAVCLSLSLSHISKISVILESSCAYFLNFRYKKNWIRILYIINIPSSFYKLYICTHHLKEAIEEW